MASEERLAARLPRQQPGCKTRWPARAEENVMHVDLVRVDTPDGCKLDGALQRPEPGTSKSLPLDAVVLVHGTGSNFYQSTLHEYLAAQFVSLGVAALRANTRGHDGISTLVVAKGGRRLGAAYEVVDECRHDVVGWTTFLRAEVGPRIGLVGHSLGAVKCLYATAHEAALKPERIIAISPPRLSYEIFCRSSRAAEFLETYQRAEQLAAAGQGATLVEATVPLPMAISAAGYLEKYGPDARYDFVPLLRRVTVPTVFTFGEQEVATNVAFQGLPEQLTAPTRDVRIVAGADHFYTGLRTELWEAIRASLHAAG
jgi:hypothetical protein